MPMTVGAINGAPCIFNFTVDTVTPVGDIRHSAWFDRIID
jgi:hypothetical protein